MTDTMRTMAERAAAYLPDTLRECMTREVLFFLGWTHLRKTPVVLLRGPTRGSGRSGSLLIAGHEPWVKYIPHRFFHGQPAREPVGEYSLSALPPILDRYCVEADLTVARIDRQSAQRIFGHEYLKVPEWVGTTMRVPEKLEQLVRSGGSIKWDMVLVRRHQYQPVLTQGAQDYDYFYRKIYLPFMQIRHGEMRVLRGETDLRRRAARGGILWVQRNEKGVAALLYERKGDMLDIVALGILEGNLNLGKEGAIAALYYFILKLAREIGCTMVDFRGSRPSLSDGLLRYKSKWGGTLYDKTDSYHDLLIRWPQGNPVVKEFLTHTPLIFRNSGGFSALLGSELQRERNLWVNGLQRCWYVKDWETNRDRARGNGSKTRVCVE